MAFVIKAHDILVEQMSTNPGAIEALYGNQQRIQDEIKRIRKEHEEGKKTYV